MGVSYPLSMALAWNVEFRMWRKRKFHQGSERLRLLPSVKRKRSSHSGTHFAFRVLLLKLTFTSSSYLLVSGPVTMTPPTEVVQINVEAPPHDVATSSQQSQPPRHRWLRQGVELDQARARRQLNPELHPPTAMATTLTQSILTRVQQRPLCCHLARSQKGQTDRPFDKEVETKDTCEARIGAAPIQATDDREASTYVSTYQAQCAQNKSPVSCAAVTISSSEGSQLRRLITSTGSFLFATAFTPNNWQGIDCSFSWFYW